MFREYSYGVIALREVNKRWQVLLVQHKEGGHWGFPKGHAEPREKPRKTAERELREETSIDIDYFFDIEPLEEKYCFMREGQEVAKKVLYFLAKASGEVKVQKQEILNYMWAEFDEAEKMITFLESKDILTKVREYFKSEK